jgi:hypothetical protein
MKQSLYFFALAAVFSLSASCIHKSPNTVRDIASLQAPNGLEGIWFLQGTSSVRGPYNGELELRKSSDGTYDAVRIITYINHYFKGYKVQEVWTGKAVLDQNALTVSYNLKGADYVTQLGALKRTPEDFKGYLNVLAQFANGDKGLASNFSDRKSTSYMEWITTRRDLEAKPLWKDERHNLDAKGRRIPLPVRAIIAITKKKIGFDKDPLVKAYSKRKEFQEERPYIVFDPTDFAFYRANRDTLRVTNKVSDDISLTEAILKRVAYSPSLY